MDGGRDRGERGEGEREGERQVKKGRRERKIWAFFFRHGPLTVSCSALQQRTRTAGPPHSTLAVIHTLMWRPEGTWDSNASLEETT